MTRLQLTVTEFNTIFANIVHHQLQLNQLCISGEISQFNTYGHHHLYFTLSDNEAHLQCVIYNVKNKAIPVIQKGDHCKVIGQCRFLKNKGQIIFSAVTILLHGKGIRHERFQDRLNDFNQQGLLRKKSPKDIPRIIEKVCIITANESAAYFDIKSILSQAPHPFETIVIPSTVQGLTAPAELQNALSIATSLNPDIICLTRGGGADQDFDCFFDTALATQICQSPIAVIAGIGHKINTTLCCLCASDYFETPSAMIQWLIHHSNAPIDTITQDLAAIKHDLLIQHGQFQHMANQLNATLSSEIKQISQEWTNLFLTLCATLDQLNPISKLSGGFNYCEIKGNPLTTIDQLTKNDTIYITLSDGKAEANVSYVHKKRHSSH
jgi:exodeoxyribonuclease VII large subunit